jgi:hypothetical protein
MEDPNELREEVKELLLDMQDLVQRLLLVINDPDYQDKAEVVKEAAGYIKIMQDIRDR